MSRRPARWASLWLVGLLSFGFGSPSRAAAPLIQTGVLVVSSWPQTGRDTAFAQRLARELIDARPERVVVSVAERLDATGSPATSSALRNADTNFRRGFISFSHESFAAAKSSFEAAIEQLSRGAAGLASVEPLVRAMHFAGSAAIELGHYRQGIGWFHRAAVIAPEASFEVEPTPGPLARLYGRVLRGATSSESGELRVESVPPRVSVSVDGRFVGVTPLALPVPLVGSHVVRLERDGYLAWGGPVEVLTGPPEELVVEMRPTAGLDRFAAALKFAYRNLGREGTGESAALTALGGLLAVDELLLVAVEPRGEQRLLLQGVSHRVKTGRTQRRGNFLLDRESSAFEPDLRAFFTELIEGRSVWVAGLGGPPPPRPRRAPDKPDRLNASSFGSRWWAWSWIGGVVAGGVVAAVLLDVAPADEPPAKAGRLLIQF